MGEATISGGTFIGDAAGVMAMRDSGTDNVKSLTITGGTFNGRMAGLLFRADEIDSVTLSGGTYSGEDSAIMATTTDATKSNTILTDILANGYIYSPEATIVSTDVDGVYIVTLDQQDVSIVQDPSGGGDTPDEPEVVPTSDTSSTTNNPPTSDNILLYVLLLVISILGFGGTGIYIKRNN